MLVLSRKVDESIVINDDIEIKIVSLKQDQVKLGISAPKNVKVYRKEIYEAIQAANKEAAISTDKIHKLKGVFKDKEIDINKGD